MNSISTESRLTLAYIGLCILGVTMILVATFGFDLAHADRTLCAMVIRGVNLFGWVFAIVGAVAVKYP